MGLGLLPTSLGRSRIRTQENCFAPRVARERVKGIEPSCPAWEAGVLPLNYTRGRIFDFRLPICKRQSYCQEITSSEPVNFPVLPRARSLPSDHAITP